MLHDRTIFPRRERDEEDGILIFDLHPAKLLLRDDVLANKHKEMKPVQLQRSRPEYMHFDKDYF